MAKISLTHNSLLRIFISPQRKFLLTIRDRVLQILATHMRHQEKEANKCGSWNFPMPILSYMNYGFTILGKGFRP